MKAFLLLFFFLALSITKAHSFTSIVSANIKESTPQSFKTSGDDDDDEKEKKCKKKHKHYRNCRGYSKNNHHSQCREHEEDDNLCHRSNGEHSRKKGRVVIELPTVVIPFPSKH